MIHYHGGPINPCDVAVKVWRGSHAFISFVHPEQMHIATEICQSFALDNGAFSMWKQGISVDWNKYYEWVEKYMNHPGFDFACIPDVIDGDEGQNDDLIGRWTDRFDLSVGAPVWHMHESIDRLEHLCNNFPRVCLGSSGEFATVGTKSWWARMNEALIKVCEDGHPITKLHGLRMLDPNVFRYLPLASADSTNVARNHNRKKSGHFIIKESIEFHNSCENYPINKEADQWLF